MTERNATHGIHLFGCTYIRDEYALDQDVDVSYVFGSKPIVYLPREWTVVLNECKVASGLFKGDKPPLPPLILMPGTEIRLINLGTADDYAKIEVRVFEEEEKLEFEE